MSRRKNPKYAVEEKYSYISEIGGAVYVLHIFLHIHPGGYVADLRDNSCYDFTHDILKFCDFLFENDILKIRNLEILLPTVLMYIS